MGRKPKIRVVYWRDAHQLLILQQAIELDPRRTVEWKARASKHLKALIATLLEDERAMNVTSGNR